LLITPLSELHLTKRYLGWLNDRQLMKYSEQRHKTHTVESCDSYRKSFDGTPHYFWAIEEVVKGLGHIGNMNAYVDPNNCLADLGILIGESSASNQHYGLEAWIAVCHFLFNEVGIRKVTAGTIALNAPMIRLAKHAGMVNDGVRTRHYICEGQEVDILYFALYKQNSGDSSLPGQPEAPAVTNDQIS